MKFKMEKKKKKQTNKNKIKPKQNKQILKEIQNRRRKKYRLNIVLRMLDFEDSKNVVHKMHNLLVLIYFFEIYYDVCSGLKYLLQPCSNCIYFLGKK